jgi:heme oxygenase
VAFHSGGKPPAPQLAPTKEYSARLAAVAKSDPLLLVAYAQTMYVALLAGGQTLARMLRATRALPPGVEGTAIFDFEATVPAAEQRRFRAALKEAVDALGEKLTGAPRRLHYVCAAADASRGLRWQPRSALRC